MEAPEDYKIDRVTVNLRIDVGLRNRLRLLAYEQNRTFANLIETVLLNYTKRSRHLAPADLDDGK